MSELIFFSVIVVIVLLKIKNKVLQNISQNYGLCENKKLFLFYRDQSIYFTFCILHPVDRYKCILTPPRKNYKIEFNILININLEKKRKYTTK